MEKLKPQEAYSEAWFRERAFNSLKKMGDNTWDYSDSLLLYSPGAAEDSYEKPAARGRPVREADNGA